MGLMNTLSRWFTRGRGLEVSQYQRSYTETVLSREEQVSLSHVWTCVRILVETLASAPIDVFAHKTLNERELLPDDPSWWVFNVRANDDMSAVSAREALWFGAITAGNAYGRLVFGAGRIKALIPLLPDNVTLDRLESGRLIYRYVDPRSGIESTYNDYDILHLKGLCEGGLLGLLGTSTMTRVAREIATAVMAERYALRFFRNDAMPAGMIVPDITLSPEVQTRLTASVKERFGGDNAQGIGVMPVKGQFLRFSTPVNESQAIDTRRLSKEEIFGAFGVPLVLGAQSSAQVGYGTNVQQLYLGFINSTLHPYDMRWNQEVQHKIYPSRAPWKECSHSFAHLLRGTEQERATASSIWVRSGVKTVNECREQEGMAPTEVSASVAAPASTSVSAASAPAVDDTSDGTSTAVPASTTANAVDPNTALNGAQVTSLRQLLLDVAMKQLPRQSVVEAISASFPLSVEQADRIVGEIGKTFFVEEEEPAQEPSFVPAEENVQQTDASGSEQQQE